MPNLRTSAGDILATKEDIFQELRLKVIYFFIMLTLCYAANLLHFCMLPNFPRFTFCIMFDNIIVTLV